ncbi:hypothetical protein AB0L63_18545 [Nocardia sp. NPDC051990]|uniref:acyl-CoA thioesterase n=1 Tax=Nocardia sp. NPDC051990 TaxID=3155285 RepID=UPI0034147DA3
MQHPFSAAVGRGTFRCPTRPAALAYVYDDTILEPVLRVFGLPRAEPQLVTASLDHAMWFHRPGPVDDWLLYVKEVVSVESGRGLGSDRFFTRDHLHLATVVQEGIIPPPALSRPRGSSGPQGGAVPVEAP